jgi:hypothetical protein
MRMPVVVSIRIETSTRKLDRTRVPTRRTSHDHSRSGGVEHAGSAGFEYRLKIISSDNPDEEPTRWMIVFRKRLSYNL